MAGEVAAATSGLKKGLGVAFKTAAIGLAVYGGVQLIGGWTAATALAGNVGSAVASAIPASPAAVIT